MRDLRLIQSLITTIKKEAEGEVGEARHAHLLVALGEEVIRLSHEVDRLTYRVTAAEAKINRYAYVRR